VKQKYKQKSLTLRTSPILTKKSISKIKGTTKFGNTRKGNIHENQLILTFRRTSPTLTKVGGIPPQPEIMRKPSPC
jgi:hypothetical protein